MVGRRRLRRVEHAGAWRRRERLFWAGYAVLVVALLSPLHAAGEALFSAHMVQHLLLTLVAAPLLLVSGPMPVVLWALAPSLRWQVGQWVAQPGPMRHVLRLLSHPIVAWSLFVVVQWGWHQPAAYELALASRWAHYAEHLTFFGSAVLFWWPVIGAAPFGSPLTYPARLLYGFLAWLPNSVLGAGLALAPAPLYPTYVHHAAEMGVDARADQLLAGLIMWVPGDLLFLSILLILLAAYFRDEERQAARIDRQLDAEERQRRDQAT